MNTANYQEHKTNRLQAQKEHLDAVLKLPTRGQGAALFGLWPERLPKSVRRKINGNTLVAWRQLRKNNKDAEWKAIEDAMFADHQEHYKAAMEFQLLEQHQDRVDEIQALIAPLANLKSITVAFPENSITFDMTANDDIEHDICLAFAQALNIGGGITVRETLALKVQAKNHLGVMEWKQQERIYGILCGNGQWETITEAQIRQAYNHDNEGNVLERDPGTSFGRLKDTRRKN